jgi:hypothetical protein
LGSLRGQLPGIVRIKTKFDPENVGDIEDIHNLFVLYSLAQDAQEKGQKRNVISAYLSAAYDFASLCKFAKLPADDPLKKAIDDVKTAIVNSMEKLGIEKNADSPCLSGR